MRNVGECNHIFVLRIAGKKAPITVPIDDKSVCPFCEINLLKARVSELEGAIMATLNENGHLADGDVCTLIDLKKAVPEWELNVKEQSGRLQQKNCVEK